MKTNIRKRNYYKLLSRVLCLLTVLILTGIILRVRPVRAQCVSLKPLQFISPANRHFVYAGRIDFTDKDAPKFYWAGNSATIGFTGTTLKIILDNQKGDDYFDVILDDNTAGRHVIHCRKGENTYTVADSLADTRHTADIFRRIDPPFSVTSFEGIEIGRQDSVFNPPAHSGLKIEFYGDSITSGYGVLDTTRKHNGDPAIMDNYVSYDAFTARHFNASYRSISRSGIGIIKSWYPLTMPQMYDRLNPNDSTSHWNFSKWTPDIVVINLFQNDSWLLPKEKHPPSGKTITDAYKRFVETLRGKYPRAEIICMLGNMDITRKGSPWPGYVRRAVKELKKKGDHRIYDLIVPYKKTPGHPDVLEQKSMANLLINKINQIMREKS